MTTVCRFEPVRLRATKSCRRVDDLASGPRHVDAAPEPVEPLGDFTDSPGVLLVLIEWPHPSLSWPSPDRIREGRNIVIEYRCAEGGYDHLPELAAELVKLNVEVLVIPGTPSALAAKQATSTIPIVMSGCKIIPMPAD